LLRTPGSRFRPRSLCALTASLDSGVYPGQLSVPDGVGMLYPNADGELREDGVNINLLTDVRERDSLTGIPRNKHVRCRVVRRKSGGN